MDRFDAASIRRARTDERRLWDLLEGILGGQAVLVAHELRLFPLLAERPRSIDEVAAALGIARRPAAALLGLCASAGLLRAGGGTYALTELAEDYLLESSPTYFGGFLDAAIASPDAASLVNVRKAIRTNTSPFAGGPDWPRRLREHPSFARGFIRAMHGHSMAAALAWPDAVDLSSHRELVDIGGGSGAHAIGAALRWPGLCARVVDLAAVCACAEAIIAGYGLQDRVGTTAGDMWTDPFPAADVHFFSDVYHDWPPERCAVLTQKSFASLPPGGRLIVHEMLLDEDKSGPFTVCAYNVALLLMSEGQQYSGRELTEMLSGAGFVDVEVKPTFGYWSIVTGRKP